MRLQTKNASIDRMHNALQLVVSVQNTIRLIRLCVRFESVRCIYVRTMHVRVRISDVKTIDSASESIKHYD